MFTPVARKQLLSASRNARSFSSSPVAAAAAVKKLGVIGAGQMVGFSNSTTTLQLLMEIGSRYRSCCCQTRRCPSYPPR